jgi:hypothetical protein
VAVDDMLSEMVQMRVMRSKSASVLTVAGLRAGGEPRAYSKNVILKVLKNVTVAFSNHV